MEIASFGHYRGRLMQPSASLIAAGNTYNPCLIIMRDKGYDLEAEAKSDESLIWVASRDGVRLSGYSPPELLGIVTLWEHYGPEWNRQSPNVLDEVLGRS